MRGVERDPASAQAATGGGRAVKATRPHQSCTWHRGDGTNIALSQQPTESLKHSGRMESPQYNGAAAAKKIAATHTHTIAAADEIAATHVGTAALTIAKTHDMGTSHGIATACGTHGLIGRPQPMGLPQPTQTGGPVESPQPMR